MIGHAGDQVVIGFSFASHWLREWFEFSGRIAEYSRAKSKQSRLLSTFNLKIASIIITIITKTITVMGKIL